MVSSQNLLCGRAFRITSGRGKNAVDERAEGSDGHCSFSRRWAIPQSGTERTEAHRFAGL